MLMIAFAATACKTEPKDQKPMSEEQIQQKADSLAKALIITDGHVDLPYWLKGRGIDKITPENGSLVIDAGEGDFDYDRAKQGGLDAPFMSIYIPAGLQETGGAKALADSLIDLVASMTTTYPDKFALAGSPAEVQENFKAGKISLPMGMENGAPIGTQIENVNYFFDRGIRYITLTHSKDNQISDSSYDTTATHQGLSGFGRLVVREMNSVGIMVDVSHISDNAFYDVMEETKVPVIASHSSCRHFTPGFERNMSDTLIKRLAENKGVIQINFGSNFLDEASQKSRDENREKLKQLLEEKDLSYDDEAAKPIIEEFNTNNPYNYADVEKVADHIDHVVNLVGIDYVGLGSDYDGVGDTLPEGLKDVSQFPNLIAELIRRGYSDEDIARICHKNVFRVWNTVLEYAQSGDSQ
ncbi:membrane dipeptidase [Psychroflexus sediminis]|uniref:Membrane dipeptidase n=2 Tax=Psychroflexus sediminis TaxID=470826 RepID=A0A1G7XZ45_9FLAO|nr:membrane dipeptidase [Psychroflexus sediminis]